MLHLDFERADLNGEPMVFKKQAPITTRGQTL